MRKLCLSAATLALVLAWANPSSADTISFDVNGSAGGGLIVDATVFDWLPGNSIIQEHVDAQGNLTGTATILFQANLGTIQTESGIDFGASSACNAGTNPCFTAVAAFDVTLTPTGPASTDFFLGAGQTGVIKIYADAERGNNLSGLGFAAGTDLGATEILSATIQLATGNFGFNLVDVNPLVDCAAGTPNTLNCGDAIPNNDLVYEALDQSNSAAPGEPAGNNYPDAYTFRGQGASNITAVVTAFDDDFFTNLQVGTSFAVTNTSQIDPYNQANPSNAFSSNAVANGDVSGVPSVCNPALPVCVNGTFNNIIAQTDANSEIRGVIPEPATLTLLGIGLAGSAAARRRQKKAAKAKAA